MKDLFNDDIFEQETDSEIMDAVSCSCVLTGIMLRNNTIPGFDAITVHKIFYITQKIIELK